MKKKKPHLVISRGFLTKHAAVPIKETYLVKNHKAALRKREELKRRAEWKHQEVEIKKVKRFPRIAQIAEMMRYDKKIIKKQWKVGKKWKKKR